MSYIASAHAENKYYFNFEQLVSLVGYRLGEFTICCPNCSTARRKSRLPVLKVWFNQPDFMTYNCAHCGAHGYAQKGGAASRVSSKDLARLQAAAAARSDEHQKRRRETAQWLWRQSRPAIGTLVEVYLRSRGILKLPGTMRFLTPSGKHPPAMLLPFGMAVQLDGHLRISESSIFAVHLTALLPDGSGKANVEPQKRIIGSPSGKPIVLAPAHKHLLVSEGVEDALSAPDGYGAWAAGSATFLPGLSEQVSNDMIVTISVDDDDAGKHGSEELGRRLMRRGIKVKLIGG